MTRKIGTSSRGTYSEGDVLCFLSHYSFTLRFSDYYLAQIWDSVPKPKAHKEFPFSLIFISQIILYLFQVVALSSFEEKEEQFKEQVIPSNATLTHIR